MVGRRMERSFSLSLQESHIWVYPAQTSWFQDPAECILHSCREYQMAKGKHKNPTNRNQDHSPLSEPSTPTPPSPGHPNTTEKLDPHLKAYLMMMVEDIKKNFNNSNVASCLCSQSVSLCLFIGELSTLILRDIKEK